MHGEKEGRIPYIRRFPAGAIHSDLARGFIRAEVVSYDDLIATGSLAKARKAGKLRLEADDVAEFVRKSVAGAVGTHLSADAPPPNDYEKTRGLFSWAYRKFTIRIDKEGLLPDVSAAVQPGDPHCEKISSTVLDAVRAAYAAREEEFTPEQMRQIERFVVLDVIDKKWKDHLKDMDALKDGIWMRSYAQKNPRIAYKQEGYELFQDMMASYREEVTDLLMKAQPIEVPIEQELEDRWDIDELGRGELGGFGEREEMTQASEHGGGEWRPTETIVRTEKRVKPNEPCPCGSGKKYKHCCMRKRGGDEAPTPGGGGNGGTKKKSGSKAQQQKKRKKKR